MENKYAVNGNKVTLGTLIVAECEAAAVAATNLQDAKRLNGKGKYTAAARLITKTAQLPGFRWINEEIA